MNKQFEHSNITAKIMAIANINGYTVGMVQFNDNDWTSPPLIIFTTVKVESIMQLEEQVKLYCQLATLAEAMTTGGTARNEYLNLMARLQARCRNIPYDDVLKKMMEHYKKEQKGDDGPVLAPS